MKLALLFAAIVGIFPYRRNQISGILLCYSIFLHLLCGLFAALYWYKNYVVRIANVIEYVVTVSQYLPTCLHLVHLHRIVFFKRSPTVLKMINRIQWYRPVHVVLVLIQSCFDFTDAYNVMNFTQKLVVPRMYNYLTFAFLSVAGFTNLLIISGIMTELSCEIQSAQSTVHIAPVPSCQKVAKTCLAAKLAVDFFSSHLLVFYFICFARSVVFCYFSIKLPIDLMEKMLCTGQVTWYLVTILYTVLCFEKFKRKVDEFYSTLFILMKRRKFLCLNQKLVLFVTMRPVAGFKICGLLTIGYPLVTSILWQVGSYLVILVQMKTG